MTNQLPAHLQGYQSRGLAKLATANLGTSAPPVISLRDNRFTAVDSAGNEAPVGGYENNQQALLRGQYIGPYLDVHIVDMNEHVSRIFYDENFDPNAQSYQPPACFSNNGIGPSRQASKPQGAVCATCPQAEWGSAISNVSGKEIPACAQYQFIAVTVPGFTKPDMPFLIRVAPNSLKNFRAYAEQFSGQTFDMDAVITRISFPSQGTIAFCAVNFVDQNTHNIGQQILADRRTENLLGKNDMARDPNAFVSHQPMQALAAPQPAAGAQQAFQPQPGQFQPGGGPAPMMPGTPLSGTVLPPEGAGNAAGTAPAAGGRGRGRGRPRNPAPQAPAAPQQGTPFAPQATQGVPFGGPAGGAQPTQGAPFGAAPQASGPAPAPASQPQPGAPFGVQSGVAPNADVQAALGQVFGR